MNLARRITPGPQTGLAANITSPDSPAEIAEILRDSDRYPSPLRPVGSASSTTRCIAANGGTLLNLSNLDRVLRIDDDTVTVQPGIALPDLAKALSEEGLELIGGFDLANRSVGGAVCAAGLEAALAADAGQFAAHVKRLKVLSPQGKKFEVTEKTKSLLALLRLSYGLLGVVYEVTLRVRPIRGFSVQTATAGFEDFSRLVPRLSQAAAGVKFYMLPFRNRVYLELRNIAAQGDPGRKLAWRFKDWACSAVLPEAIHSLGKVVPIRQIRYPLIDSLSKGMQRLFNNSLLKRGSNAVEQSGRFRGLGKKKRFTYCTWAFPASHFERVLIAYRDFCARYYAHSRYRCDMPSIGFRLNQDRSALLSPSFDQPLFTISSLSTQSKGWNDFVFELAEFAAAHGGIPFFNQTRNASPELVSRCMNTRLTFFRKVRRELDPRDRLLNQFFATYMVQ